MCSVLWEAQLIMQLKGIFAYNFFLNTFRFVYYYYYYYFINYKLVFAGPTFTQGSQRLIGQSIRKPRI